MQLGGEGDDLFRDVAKVFSGPPQLEALKPCSFVVAAGELVTITGPSGSGKSTLLNLAGLLDQPSQGQVIIDGLNTSLLRDRERTAVRGQFIGFVFQAFHLMDRRTVQENVSLAGLYRGRDSATRREAARTAIQLVGLGDRSESRAGVLSGGERQRVAIARAMAVRPAILLCDEPTGNLDTANSEAIVELLSELNTAGTTVILITHNPAVAAIGTQRLSLLDGVVGRA